MTKPLWRSTVPAVTLQVGGQGTPGTAVPDICCHSGLVGALRCIGLGAEPAGASVGVGCAVSCLKQQ